MQKTKRLMGSNGASFQMFLFLSHRLQETLFLLTHYMLIIIRELGFTMNHSFLLISLMVWGADD